MEERGHNPQFSMLKWLIIIYAGLWVWTAGAQDNSADTFFYEVQKLKASTHYSLSRQFVVLAPEGPKSLSRRLVVTNNLVEMDPSFLTVSCERIKKALLQQLGARDQWKGNIIFQAHPFRNVDEPVIVTSTRYGDGWNYKVSLPDRLEPSRLVSATVQVLLLEMANRHSDRSVEVPLWLTEGLARQLFLSRDVYLVVQPPGEDVLWFRGEASVVAVSRELRDERKTNALAQAHAELKEVAPLTFDELSWPREGTLKGQYEEAYKSSAQLLVQELLTLPNGRASMGHFISNLSQYLNWQIAFRTAFQSHFATQRDLEKWWTLKVVNFTGRNLENMWSTEDSIKKLDEVVRPPVQIRLAADELPMQSEVSLQLIIQEWDFVRQTQILQNKIQQLNLLRHRVSPETVALTDGYRKVIEFYLKKRDKAGFSRTARRQSTPGLDKVAQQTVSELDLMDAERELLRPKHGRNNDHKGETASVPVKR